MIKFLLGLLILITGLFIMTCSDPASSDDQYIVKTLIDEYWGEGEYSVFWDGTDDHNKLQPSGTYYIRLWTNKFSHQIEMTALDGDYKTSNDSTKYFPTPTFITQLFQNHPEPFIISEGTNIPFQMSESTQLRLTIRNHE